MCLHGLHALQSGRSNILVSTVDTDVIVILLGQLGHFLAENADMQLWVEFGHGKDRSLGLNMSHAVHMFHVFTGADTISQFYGKGKKKQHGSRGRHIQLS